MLVGRAGRGGRTSRSSRGGGVAFEDLAKSRASPAGSSTLSSFPGDPGEGGPCSFPFELGPEARSPLFWQSLERFDGGDASWGIAHSQGRMRQLVSGSFDDWFLSLNVQCHVHSLHKCKRLEGSQIYHRISNQPIGARRCGENAKNKETPPQTPGVHLDSARGH